MKKILLSSALLISSIVYSQVQTVSNGDWGTPSVWSTSSVPSNTDNVEIRHSIDIDNTRTCADLTIDADARLDVDAALTVTGTVINNGELRVRNADMTHSGTTFTNNKEIYISAGMDLILSNASVTLTNTDEIQITSDNGSLFGGLMMGGTFTNSSGKIIYKRYVASTTYWDLIGSPVTGVLIEDFEEDNGDIAHNGSAMAIGYYTNTSEAYSSNDGWTNYTTSTVGTAGSFTSAKGYQMATNGGSLVEFTGSSVNTGNVDITATTNEEGDANANDGTKFELIANPYTSYLSVTSFINAHKDTQLHDHHASVYGWDGAQYDTYSLASPGNGIAPAQGFMIGVRGSDGTSQTITFTTAMQTSSGSGDYSEQDPMEDDRAELFINLNQNDYNKETKLFFLEQGTDGLDVGYDAATMDLGNYSIYSRLVADDEGVNMDHQSLAFSEMWDKVIPLGVNALAGEEITLGISHRTTPADLNIYLEDAVEGTMIDIKAGDYTLTPSSDINGVGRFFIHMTADTMSNGEVSTSMLNAFKEINANYITLEGLATQSNNINVSLYNILGRKVLDTSLNNNANTQTISTLGMASGIYVIELESENDRLTKKLIIQ
mgnify:CR=1 FL=1